ncbi:UDP-glucose iridoid glucosyltransferase-like [Heracleum sosnowskyi]|uniref:UDP-glucose iridoid glucosyltransferase-like n=1 Tax=Heracleum sosnowskyi TaxID=360622 RepID=A0AAD8M0E5_9APIA|nr:UDP-glucose iridoid glucosyltransferase-like [Heracleum sosnowskyi]
MENQEPRRRPNVVIVPGPFQGHISPMLDLGTVLHSKGFGVIFAHTVFNAPDPSNHPDFIFLPLPDNLADHQILPGDIIALVTILNKNCEEPLKKGLSEIMNRLETENQVVCIIYDMLMYFCESVAKDLKLCCMIFRPSSASAGLAYLSLSRLQAEGYIPPKGSALDDLVPGLPLLRFKDIPTADMGTLQDAIELTVNICNTRTSSAIICNTVHHLEPEEIVQFQHIYPLQYFPIGPLHILAPTSSSSLLEPDTDCLTWLDNQAPRSVIYVSIGSLAILQKEELAEMAWGLASSNQPFLWVVRSDAVPESEWADLIPEGFLETVGERGCIVKWAPQKDVLEHNAVGGFWSHCGWNSTLESISAGVPMICWPCFSDQKVNSRYLSHVWKVGLELDHKLERGVIKESIRRLMVDNEGEKIRVRANDLKQKMKISVSEGGLSYASLNNLVDFILSF